MSQSLPGQAALESFLGILEMFPEMRRMILGIPGIRIIVFGESTYIGVP